MGTSYKIIQTRFIRKGYSGFTLYPFIFVRDKSDKVLVNHERIHWQQQKQLGLLRFLWMYFRDWYRFGYDNIPLEKEAKENERNMEYQVK